MVFLGVDDLPPVPAVEGAGLPPELGLEELQDAALEVLLENRDSGFASAARRVAR